MQMYYYVHTLLRGNPAAKYILPRVSSVNSFATKTHAKQDTTAATKACHDRAMA